MLESAELLGFSGLQVLEIGSEVLENMATLPFAAGRSVHKFKLLHSYTLTLLKLLSFLEHHAIQQLLHPAHIEYMRRGIVRR